mmetsp:Transcript_82925/g.222449  ORF Transcript_82925/g.222449 Transcript_82925/m.222449 type:complete len:123 (-) Transcript_82925:265-633(-)
MCQRSSASHRRLAFRFAGRLRHSKRNVNCGSWRVFQHRILKFSHWVLDYIGIRAADFLIYVAFWAFQGLDNRNSSHTTPSTNYYDKIAPIIFIGATERLQGGARTLSVRTIGACTESTGLKS